MREGRAVDKRDLFGHTAPATQPPDALPAGEKRERGAYYTPDSLALACAQLLADYIPPPERIIEPGCGGGSFLRAANATWPKAQLLGVDLVPACTGPGIVRTQDLFDESIPREAFDLAIGNPDFDIAERVVRRGLELVRFGGSVAFLLRLGFLASQSRVPLYREHPLSIFAPIAGRPSFTGGGTDQYDYGFFVWTRGSRGFAGAGKLLQPLEWKR